MIKIYKDQICVSDKKTSPFPYWKSRVLFLLAIVLTCSVSFAQTGTTPVNPPAVGFNIDGGLKVYSALGDWAKGTGTGGHVFNNDGTTVTGLHAKLIRDAYSSNSDVVFAEGSKASSSPNEWSWTTGTATDKSDINNAMYLVTTDPATGDTWIVIGGDRKSTNGTSYIDFEFLQKSITRNLQGNNFISAGTDGGRTVNDLSITVGYSGGGSTPTVTVYVWKPTATGFAYEVIPAASLANKIFAATNLATADVPFLAFGNSQYQPYAFVEAAINVTALFGAISPCMGINVDNVVIKTKASDVESAALKDFVEPIPVNISFGSAEFSYAAPLCKTGTASANFTTGSVRGGTFGASGTGLVMNATTGEIDLAASTPGTYSITYSFETFGCAKSATTSVTILYLPTVPTLSATHPTCESATGNVTVTSATADLTFSIDGKEFVSYPATGFTGLAAGVHTVVAKNANGCVSPAAEITINPQPVMPTANAGESKMLTCAVTSVQLTGSSATEGATYAWVASNGGNIVAGGTTLTPTVDAPGTYTLTVSHPDSECTAQSVVMVTEDLTTPSAAIASENLTLTCSVPTVMLNGQTNLERATFSWAGPDGFTSNEQNIEVGVAGEYTLTVINSVTGCAASDVIVVLENKTSPVANAGADKVITCANGMATLEGSSDKENVSYTWVASEGGHIESGADAKVATVNTAGTYTLTVTDLENGCSSEDVVVVTQDNTALVVSVSMPVGPSHITCNEPSVMFSGVVQIDGVYNPDGILYSWTGPEGFTSDQQGVTVSVPGVYTLTATNAVNGCSATVTHTVTGPVIPDVQAGPDKAVTCANPAVTLEGSSNHFEGWASYTWVASEGGHIVSGANTLTPVVDAAGTYTLTVTDSRGGCSASDVVMVTGNSTMPQISAMGGTLSCQMQSVQLTGFSTTAGVNYSWTGPDGYTSTGQNPTVTLAGEYTLTVTNPATGCMASATVVVHPVPTGSAPATTCHMLAFGYEEYNKGLVTTLQTKDGPVAVMGRKRNPDGSYALDNHAAIFDSQTPTGDDTDLYTSDWGQVLIINQDQTQVPNDNQWGGELILDFSAIGPVTMESMKALDIDGYENMSWVHLYDAAGNELYKVQLQNLGDNSRQVVNLGNTKGVMMMKVVLDGRDEVGSLAGSGAIDDIKFCVEKVAPTPCVEPQEEEENEMELGIGNAVAYPTPFQDRGTVKFRLPRSEQFVVNLYDTKGTLIRQLKAGTAVKGELNTIEVDGRNLAEGMYLVRLVSTSGSKTLKMILKR